MNENSEGLTFFRYRDLAVTVDKDINFLARNGTLLGKTVIANATKMSAMAYDDYTHTMFLSDMNNREYAIFSVDLRLKNVTVKPILKRDKDSPIVSMAFDTPSRTLFWTTKWSLMKMKMPRDRSPNKPSLVHKFDVESARDIALDSCNKRIYWTTSNRSSPSIMRANLDGSDMKTLITENLYEPTSIAVDHTNSRLYWIDDEEGIHYKLETSNSDGSSRTVLVHGTHQTPLHLALDKQNLYWTEMVHNAIWRIDKEPLAEVDLPKKLISYYEKGQSEPTSILAMDNLGSEIDCKSMKIEEIKREKILASTLKSANNLTSDDEDVSDDKGICANGGTINGTDCKCKPGYSGSRCEISVCHNYCLQGECFVNDKGLPVCKCSASHNGLRCEHDICDGYCLNAGRCSVYNGKPICDCKYSSGVRCEVTFNMAEICALFCVNKQLQINSVDTSSCRCTELNQTIEEVLNYDNFNCTFLMPLLAVIVVMMTIVVIILSVYVNRLRRRPRVKKRFVVNKGGGITPLTSRPSQLTTDQCEITIENCCNMNICETPCFEPKLRTSITRSNVIKEEKSNLLDNMEGGNNSC
ncbi:protein cueball isoform X2 [Phymastichus coffea]|uniref:protein cueball isoform X2 n=1 Tax=Phymastichus coffea TaxID=108790 RepID=UPI00273B7630|nr:protein cueball isoform X2 [Phymastichus coffea]